MSNPILLTGTLVASLMASFAAQDVTTGDGTRACQACQTCCQDAAAPAASPVAVVPQEALKALGYAGTSAGAGDERGYMGIRMSLEGGAMTVAEVMAGGGAEKAGLQAGDRILRVDGASVKETDSLLEHLAGLQAGQTVRVVFERDGTQQRARITLASLADIEAAGERPGGGLRRVEEIEEIEEDTVDEPRILTWTGEAGKDGRIHIEINGQEVELDGLGQGLKVLGGDGQGVVMVLEGDGIVAGDVQRVLEIEGDADEAIEIDDVQEFKSLKDRVRSKVQKRLGRTGRRHAEGEGKEMLFEVEVETQAEGEGHRGLFVFSDDDEEEDIQVDGSGRIVIRTRVGDGPEEVQVFTLGDEDLGELPKKVRTLLRRHGVDGHVLRLHGDHGGSVQRRIEIGMPHILWVGDDDDLDDDDDVGHRVFRIQRGDRPKTFEFLDDVEFPGAHPDHQELRSRIRNRFRHRSSQMRDGRDGRDGGHELIEDLTERIEDLQERIEELEQAIRRMGRRRR